MGRWRDSELSYLDESPSHKILRVFRRPDEQALVPAPCNLKLEHLHASGRDMQGADAKATCRQVLALPRERPKRPVHYRNEKGPFNLK